MRAGSGLLFALFGAAVLALGRRRAENVALGVASIGFGGSFAVYNVVALDPVLAGPGLLLTGGLRGAAALGFVALVVSAARRDAHARRGAGVAAVVAAVAAGLLGTVVLALGSDAFLEGVERAPVTRVPALVEFAGASAMIVASSLWAIQLAWMHAHEADAAARRRARLCAVGFGIYVSFYAGSEIPAEPLALARLGHIVVAAFAASAAWVLAAEGEGSRAARNVGLLLFAAMLAGAIDQMVFPASPVVGIVRIAAFATLVHGVLRHGLLGFDLSVPTARRGTLATIGLVGFFAVAQVAQEFLSGTMGIVLGGVAAGVLLFAAAPLQRAAERLASREVPTDSAGPGRRAGAVAESTFKAAVRAARHDGVVTAAEERHLAEVADGLGLTPGEMVRLRHEVEGEYGEVR